MPTQRAFDGPAHERVTRLRPITGAAAGHVAADGAIAWAAGRTVLAYGVVRADGVVVFGWRRADERLRGNTVTAELVAVHAALRHFPAAALYVESDQAARFLANPGRPGGEVPARPAAMLPATSMTHDVRQMAAQRPVDVRLRTGARPSQLAASPLQVAAHKVASTTARLACEQITDMDVIADAIRYLTALPGTNRGSFRRAAIGWIERHQRGHRSPHTAAAFGDSSPAA